MVMFRSREGGFSLLDVLGGIAVIALMLGLFLWVAFNDHYASVVKKEFQLSSPSRLSSSEADMVRPMVYSVLEKLRQEANTAKEVELKFSSRTDMAPDNAEQAITDFRSAQKKVSVALQRLYDACRAARYFNLIPGDLSFCK